MNDSAVEDRYRKAFAPRQYLRQYYSMPHLSRDDAALFGTLTAWLRSGSRQYATALDFGCGPTLHYSFAVAPCAAQIDLADYLPANLAEIQGWLDERPDSHDWDALLRGVIECGGDRPERLSERKLHYRSRVRRLLPCDLRLEQPIADGNPRYDLVTSFFCSECVAGSAPEWEVFLGRIIDLVGPGGDIFVAHMRSCSSYRVLGAWFGSVSVTEGDVVEVMMRNGYSSESIQVEVIDAPDWAEAGFDRIVVVGARGRSARTTSLVSNLTEVRGSDG